MLNKNKIAEEMSLHFSKWMDIRKRLNSSSGGALIHSVAEEIEKINKSIQEYKKDFFLRTYLYKTEEIVSFLYRGFIGDLNKDYINVDGFREAENKKDFYKNKKTYYIEDNYIYIKEKGEYLEYSYKDYPLKVSLSKHHVWNVYDEFATFLGLTRYNGENNKDLLNRIIAESINKPNSDEEGLKNAIKNSVINYVELSNEDITIESITPYNIKKYQNHFEEILEELTFINKDVLRAKRWDVDLWEYGFNNIDYIPHLWDVIIEDYIDGTGYNDSVKVGITNKPSHANVKFSFYEKSEKMIDEYIKNKNVNHNINMELIKYKDQLNMEESEYKIDAYTIKDITNQNIEVESYRTIEKQFNENVVNMIDEVLPETIDSKINIDLNQDDKFTFKFKPKSNNHPMNIDQFYIIKNNEKINLLEDMNLHHPFIYEDGSIKNTRCFKYANKRSHFTSYQNVYFDETNNTIDMANIAKKSSLSLQIDGANNKFVNANYEILPSIIPIENIKLEDFSQTGSNMYSTNKKYGEMYIELEANYVALEIKGKAEVSINNSKVLNIVNEDYKKLIIKNESQSSEHIKVRIKDFDNNTSIRIPEYKHYKINYKVQHGKITKLNDNLILPNENNNHLTIEFNTYTGRHFSIYGIYIGNDTINDYLEFSGTWSNQIEDIYIDTNCLIELYKDDKMIDSNYKPSLLLVSKEDNQFVKLNLSSYLDIKINDSDIVRRDNEYYLVLNKGETKSHIEFYATKIENHKKERLNDVLKINQEDKIYITNAIDEFLIKRSNGDNEKKLLSKNLFEESQDIYKINNLDKEIISSFVTDSLGNKVNSDTTNNNFEYITFTIPNGKHYIAINKYKMYNTEEENVEIINNFQEPIIDGENLYYVITSLNKKFEVLFMNYKNWSIGREKVYIKSLDEINTPDNYQKEVSFINHNFTLSKEIRLSRYIDGHDLTNSIIKVPEGHSVFYEKKYVNDDIITAPEFFREETIINNNNNIVKLKSTNIDEIIYLGYDKWDQESSSIIDHKYNLLKEEGILILEEGLQQPLNIVYTIKIPSKIVISDDILYSKVSIPITAFKKIGEVERIIDTQNDVNININEIFNREYDKLDILIDSPNLSWSVEGDIVKIYSKDIAQDSVTINPGYYYQDGKEYYMYHTPIFMNKKNYDNITKENIRQEDGYLIFNKEAYNLIKNTSFSLHDEDTIFFADYEYNFDNIVGTTSERLTSCDNFNYWNKVNTIIELSKGINGTGIKIKPRSNDKSYIYIDITDHIKDNNYITMYAEKNIEADVAIGLNKSSNINNYANKKYGFSRAGQFLTINLSNIDHIRTNKVYLVVSGEGMFDDIIISKEQDFSKHKKNLKDLHVPPLQRYTNRKIYIDNILDSGEHLQTEANDNVLSTATNVNWMEKEIISYNTRTDWNKCKLYNIDLRSNKVFTLEKNGKIETPFIEIPEGKVVENIILTVNDMTNYNDQYNLKIKTGHTIRNINEIIGESNGTFLSINNDKLKRYIKIEVDIPSYSFINNISMYITYKEDNVAKPHSIQYNKGKYLSKVFDLEKPSNYTIEDIVVNNIKNDHYIKIQVRAARLNDRLEYVWTDWKNIQDKPSFSLYNLFQFQIDINDKDAYIDIEKIIIEESE